MTKSLAKELEPKNIRVNTIAPGMIDTQINSHLTNEEIKEFVNEIQLGRIGKTQDVANVVSFLSSDKLEYITGQVINVDGGVVI